VRVLVSGYYGFGNLGDEALLSGLLGGLREGEHDPTVLSHRPAATAALHGTRAVSRTRGLLPALLRHDALVSGGGGLLQDKTSARSLGYYLGVIRLAKALGKRVVVYGQSVGPLSERGQRAVGRALAGVQVAVREEASSALLANLGVPSELVADAALLLPEPSVTPAANAPVLLIPRGGYPEVTEALGELARRLHAEGIPVAGLAFQPSEDASPLHRMKAHAPALQLLHAETPWAALNLVAGSRYVVSARLHGLILAARSGRPFSGVAYDPKVSAFMAEAGGRAHPLPPDPKGLFEEVMRGCFDAHKVQALVARAHAGLHWLDRALQPPPQP